MVKFIVVVYRKPETSGEQLRRYFQEVHGPMAEKLPGLKKYVQNFVMDDPSRKRPGWDAIIELSFLDREAMEAAWASAEGRAATADLDVFADLSRTSWSVVEEVVVR